MIILRTRTGDIFLKVDVDKQKVHLVVGDEFPQIVIPVHFKHLEKFAIELLNATGHNLDPKEI